MIQTRSGNRQRLYIVVRFRRSFECNMTYLPNSSQGPQYDFFLPRKLMAISRIQNRVYREKKHPQLNRYNSSESNSIHEQLILKNTNMYNFLRNYSTLKSHICLLYLLIKSKQNKHHLSISQKWLDVVDIVVMQEVSEYEIRKQK